MAAGRASISQPLSPSTSPLSRKSYNQLDADLDELKRIEAAGELWDELLDNIELITKTLYGMKEGSE